MPNILAFDIETAPDIDGGRKLYGLDGLTDEEIAQVMFSKQREIRDTEFLPLHLHRVIVISIALRSESGFKVWSLGSDPPEEKETISRFFAGIDRYSPILVSWNGGGFDLPVLHYRSLIQKVTAQRYWESGEGDREFKWNNYLNRFHSRHTDLMDVLAGYQPRAVAPLDQISMLCGLPGKLGMDGSQVWDAFREGRFTEVRDYCETDALNTYLLYLRWEFVRGNFSSEQYGRECALVRSTLEKQDKTHFNRFLDAWDDDAI